MVAIEESSSLEMIDILKEYRGLMRKETVEQGIFAVEAVFK